MRRGLDLRVLLPGALLLVSLGASCADTYAQGNAPPATSFYYPTSVVVLTAGAGSDARRFALVSNTNFDLRFAAGWLSVVDLQVLTDPSRAPAKPSDPGLVRQQLRVPSFAGPIAGDLTTPFAAGETRHAFIAHRGTRLISAIKISVGADLVPTLSCGVSGSKVGMGDVERRTDCDGPHFFDLSDPSGFDVDPLDLFDPYAVALYTDQADQSTHLAVSFLSHSNAETILLTFRVGTADAEKLLTAEYAIKIGAATVGQILPLVTAADAGTCEPATSGGPVPDGCVRARLVLGSRVYGTGTDQSQLRVVTFSGPDSAVTLSYHLLTSDVGGVAVSGLTFSPAGDRAFVVNRSPDSLVSLDLTLATPAAGSTAASTATKVLNQPRFGLLDVLPLGSQPTEVLYLDRSPVPLLTVPRFRSRELDVVASPGDALVSVAVVTDIGSGPYASGSWREANGDDLVLVSTFFDHGLSVVRVPAGDPGASALYRRVRSAELGDATTY